MTVRDAILLAIPVFAAHPRGGPADVRAGLEAAGVPAGLAAEIVEFLPLALARAMLDGMGIQFADHYVRQTAQGRVIGQKLLTDEPVYREGLAIAGEIGAMGGDAMDVPGFLEARDPETGDVQWRWNTTPRKGEPSACCPSRSCCGRLIPLPSKADALEEETDG